MALSKPLVKSGSGRGTRWKKRRALVAALVPAPFRIALAVFGLAWLLALLRGPLTLDIGAPDALDTLYLGGSASGFFEPESRPPNPQFPQADTTYRWAGPRSVLRLPWPLDAQPLKVYLRLTAPRPGLAADQTGAILKARGKLEWSDDALGGVAVNGVYQGNYYLFELPPHLRPNLAAYELSLEADNTFRPTDSDGRSLAVLFFSARIEPNYAQFGWRGWLATFEMPALLAFISFCCWGIVQSLWPGGRRALLTEGVAGGLLLLSIWGWPLAAEPLYAPYALILPAGWLLLGLAGLFQRRAVNLPPIFVYTATLFPLLPLVQFAFGRLYLYGVNSGSVLLGVYVGAMFYAGAMYINSGPARPQVFEHAFQRGMLLAAGAVFVYNHLNVFSADPDRGLDFRLHYGALQGLAEGHALYGPHSGAQLAPGFSVLLWPFYQLLGSDINLALFSWRVLNELLLIGCLLLLLRLFRPDPALRPALWFVILNFGQLANNLSFGGFGLPLLLGLSLLALWCKEKRPGLAGIALSLPVSLTFYPFLTTGLFWRKPWQTWRAWLGLAAGLVGMSLLVGLAVGFEPIGAYFGQVAFATRGQTGTIDNQSLWGFWGRLGIGKTGPTVQTDPGNWQRLAAWLSVITLTVVTLLVLWRRRGLAGWGSQQLRLAALVWLSLLVPPVVGFDGAVPGLLALLVMLVALCQGGKAVPKWQLLLFALTYAALAYGDRRSFFSEETVAFSLFIASYRGLAILGAWGLSLWLLWQTRPAAIIQPANEQPVSGVSNETAGTSKPANS